MGNTDEKKATAECGRRILKTDFNGFNEEMWPAAAAASNKYEQQTSKGRRRSQKHGTTIMRRGRGKIVSQEEEEEELRSDFRRGVASWCCSCGIIGH
jgi:hypothetical protein